MVTAYITSSSYVCCAMVALTFLTGLQLEFVATCTVGLFLHSNRTENIIYTKHNLHHTDSYTEANRSSSQ